MQTDLEYLRGMLNVFIDSPMPMISTQDLVDAGYEISEAKGLFHYLQLIERGFVSNHLLEMGNPKALGLVMAINGVSYWVANIRLTSAGQDFAATLRQKDVFEKLKGISDQPLSVIKDVGSELLKSYTKKMFGLD
ncbi:DUF2513 domain-containing protein [Pantoea brenneri]|uniref:DUF2513 domain-containing protein n=1 Tax=Pantoea brenneri TaxID=472694 RepID=UPI00210A9BC2|nr:DUF2513 domain-containing protein [Pantoea brenneri]MCQ5469698.1 DUF2513 domain-containing protein [Pantoea brenneri]